MADLTAIAAEKDAASRAARKEAERRRREAKALKATVKEVPPRGARACPRGWLQNARAQLRSSVTALERELQLTAEEREEAENRAIEHGTRLQEVGEGARRPSGRSADS